LRGLILLSAAGLLVAACAKNNSLPLVKQTRLLMDTYVTITAAGPQKPASAAVQAAFDRMEEISRKFNHLDTLSPVYRFNTRNEPITDSEVVNVVRAAQQVSEATGGVFDVTVEPLVRLWGFYGDEPALPDPRAIDSCRALVGYRKLSVQADRVTKDDSRVTIDLGGIAKGYALAEAAAVLRGRGVDSALIDLGGDVYALGRKAGQNWKIGVRNPRADGILGVVQASNLAVVTSGDYERFFFGPDSMRYCHIIDPRTGRPAQGIASTTVIMRDPLESQGWSKVLFILGPQAMRYAGQAGFEAMIINDSLRAFLTPGLAGILDSTALQATRESLAGRDKTTQ